MTTMTLEQEATVDRLQQQNPATPIAWFVAAGPSIYRDGRVELIGLGSDVLCSYMIAADGTTTLSTAPIGAFDHLHGLCGSVKA